MSISQTIYTLNCCFSLLPHCQLLICLTLFPGLGTRARGRKQVENGKTNDGVTLYFIKYMKITLSILPSSMLYRFFSLWQWKRKWGENFYIFFGKEMRKADYNLLTTSKAISHHQKRPSPPSRFFKHIFPPTSQNEMMRSSKRR